jgi:hypothetical protein
MREIQADPSLMWSPSLLANFNLRKPHIVNDNVTVREIIAMHDSLKG